MTHSRITCWPRRPGCRRTRRSPGWRQGTTRRTSRPQFPSSSAAWATLAEAALADGRAVEAYAYARTGYHRGLDALRRAGWKGQGQVPWSHAPNRGVLRAIHALARAAEAIGETAERERCDQLLADSDPEAVTALR